MKKLFPNWLIWAFAIISYIGFLDATYLTVTHFAGAELSCTIYEGCNEVTQSSYSEIFGIPIALGGALYYLAVFLSTLLYFDTKRKFFMRLIPFFTILGFICTLYLLYLQFYVINAVCIYCIFSALTTTILFFLSLFLIRRRREELESIGQI